MAAVWVYVTASDNEEAEMLGRAMVDERLAACANILGRTTAIYWWEGRVESSSEVALVLKTSDDMVASVTANCYLTWRGSSWYARFSCTTTASACKYSAGCVSFSSYVSDIIRLRSTSIKRG